MKKTAIEVLKEHRDEAEKTKAKHEQEAYLLREKLKEQQGLADGYAALAKDIDGALRTLLRGA